MSMPTGPSPAVMVAIAAVIAMVPIVGMLAFSSDGTPAPPPPPLPQDGPAPIPAGPGDGEPPPTDGSPPADDSDDTDPGRGVDVVPADQRPRLSPLLAAASAWPADTALVPLDRVPEAKQPPASEVNTLIELVRPLVAESLMPDEPASKLGRDAKDRLFLQLGDTTQGVYGQASLDMTADIPTLAFRWTWRSAREASEDTLAKRLRQVTSGGLGSELESPGTERRTHPLIKGPKQLQATYQLDRGGFGVTYPFLVLYITDTTLIAIFQQPAANHEPR